MVHYFLKLNRIYWDKDCCSVYKPDNDLFFFIHTEGNLYRIRGPPVSQLQQGMEKKLEDERMEKKQTDSVQNRFTAYLMVAVANKRISYFEQRNRYKEKEYIQVDFFPGRFFWHGLCILKTDDYSISECIASVTSLCMV